MTLTSIKREGKRDQTRMRARSQYMFSPLAESRAATIDDDDDDDFFSFEERGF